jgi:hypothetical protein
MLVNTPSANAATLADTTKVDATNAEISFDDLTFFEKI